MNKTNFTFISSIIILFFNRVQGFEGGTAQAACLMDSAKIYLMTQDYRKAERMLNAVSFKLPEKKRSSLS